MASSRMKPQDGIAWVTGASSGIGAAVALELARRGWTVAVTARRVDALEALARRADGLPGRIVAHAGDVTNGRTMRTIVETIEAIHGPLALAFLNAGVAPRRRADEAVSGEAVTEALAVNLVGVANGLSAVLPGMTLRQRGHVAVNASLVGYRGLPGAAVYGASKAAAIHLCESLRFDCERAGVRLQIVNPGFVDTPMTRRNRFAMPFLMTAEEGAQRIVDGFARGGFEIAFPRRLAWPMKALRLLPHPLYFALISLAERRSLKGS